MELEWVREAMIIWGLARRRIDMGGKQYTAPDGGRRWHLDGWPTRSIQGKTKDEGEGAGQGATGQHYPEVMTGDALLVHRALYGAPARLQDIGYAHYVIPREVASVKEKQRQLGYANARAYYHDINRLHVWVAARWDTRQTEDVRTMCA